MELIGIFILVIPFVIGYLFGKQAGIKEEFRSAQKEPEVDQVGKPPCNKG